MRVLYAAHFDPAGVMASHRTALRVEGVEAFLALNVDYHGAGVDRTCPPPDIIVVCPGIGTGEPVDLALDPTAGVLPLPPEVEAILKHFPKARRVAYFHGSVNTAANTEAYAHVFRARGFTLAASTLDYCTWLDAAYLPPAIFDVGAKASPRLDRHAFYVAHTPTNPRVCHSAEFLTAAIECGIPVRYVTGVPAAEALAVKRACHAVFDHLRGAFSVNSLEAAALGAIPIFGMTRETRIRLAEEGLLAPPVPYVETMEHVRQLLRALQASPSLTRALQAEALAWAGQFSPPSTAQRLISFYGGL